MTNSMRTCNVCGETKPLTEYYKTKKDGKFYHGKCKSCYVKKQQEKYDPRKGKDKNLRYSYGIGIEDYDRMFEEQEGKCKICGATEAGGRKSGRGKMDGFYVDHCHDTGKVRGLLCIHCNRALGLVGDNIDTLTRMITYLNDNN